MSAQKSGDFFTLSFHAAKACEIAMRRLIAPSPKEQTPSKVRAVCTQSGDVIFGPARFEKMIANLQLPASLADLGNGIQAQLKSAHIGRVSFERFGGLWVLGVDTNDLLDRLTARQAEVAQLVAQGMTDKEIAQSLDLAVSTVSNHVKDILRRLNANTRGKVRQAFSSPILPS